MNSQQLNGTNPIQSLIHPSASSASSALPTPIPTVALFGIPHGGKTTLYNRLIQCHTPWNIGLMNLPHVFVLQLEALVQALVVDDPELTSLSSQNVVQTARSLLQFDASEDVQYTIVQKDNSSEDGCNGEEILTGLQEKPDEKKIIFASFLPETDQNQNQSPAANAPKPQTTLSSHEILALIQEPAIQSLLPYDCMEKVEYLDDNLNDSTGYWLNRIAQFFEKVQGNLPKNENDENNGENNDENSNKNQHINRNQEVTQEDLLRYRFATHQLFHDTVYYPRPGFLPQINDVYDQEEKEKLTKEAKEWYDTPSNTTAAFTLIDVPNITPSVLLSKTRSVGSVLNGSGQLNHNSINLQQKKKQISADDINLILFVVSLSDYNFVGSELLCSLRLVSKDGYFNDSVKRFGDTIKLKKLEKSKIVVAFNKYEIFLDKLKHRPFSNYTNYYGQDDDVDSIIEWIKERYLIECDNAGVRRDDVDFVFVDPFCRPEEIAHLITTIRGYCDKTKEF